MVVTDRQVSYLGSMGMQATAYKTTPINGDPSGAEVEIREMCWLEQPTSRD